MSPAAVERRRLVSKYEHALRFYAENVYPAAENVVIAQRSWNPIKRKKVIRAAATLQSELKTLTELLVKSGLEISRPGAIQGWCQEFATRTVQPNISVNDARTRKDKDWVEMVHDTVIIFLNYSEGDR